MNCRTKLTFDNKIDYLRPMRTLTINLPGTIDLDDKEAKMVLATKLYELGKLTLGQAAELAGYSKETFMELLADYGVSFFNYSPEELDEDIKNAEDYSL
ncbi:MAG: UPF0175 family protein [Anditalea sp.]